MAKEDNEITDESQDSKKSGGKIKLFLIKILITVIVFGVLGVGGFIGWAR